jgi:hypothetical protein
LVDTSSSDRGHCELKRITKKEQKADNLVPVDFLVMDVECNNSCPIILGRSFLRTVGAIIDMREGTIKYQFPLKKGMEHFPRKRKKFLFDSIPRENYELDASSFDVT